MTKFEELKDRPIEISNKSWSWSDVKNKVIRESDESLVPLSLAPDKILVRPQYYIQGIPGALSESYTREGVYEKLIEATKLLPSGYKFIIFDCWRPLKVQQSLFDILKYELKRKNPSLKEKDIINKTLTYVALPSRDKEKPSPHNTGGAVDLTIADEEGRLLNMGTCFDDTTIKASTTYFENQLSEGMNLNSKEIEAMENRRLLYNIMTSVGFTNYLDEWWHYDYGNQNWAWMSESNYAIYGKIAPNFVWNKEIE